MSHVYLLQINYGPNVRPMIYPCVSQDVAERFYAYCTKNILQSEKPPYEIRYASVVSDFDMAE